MRKLFLVLSLAGFSAVAQTTETSFQLRADFRYSQMTYKESTVAQDKGFMTGAQLELLMSVMESAKLGISGGYATGYLSFAGDTWLASDVRTLSKDWIRDLRAGIYFGTGLSNLFIGYAQRDWYSALRESYARESVHEYIPIRAFYAMGGMYFAAEYRHWIKGQAEGFLNDADAARMDVVLKQDKGTGYAAELGYVFAATALATRLAVLYEKWSIDPSDAVSDGVDVLQIPKNETELISFVIGLTF